jgi:Spy/CpxP family protein refolding chaperone
MKKTLVILACAFAANGVFAQASAPAAASSAASPAAKHEARIEDRISYLHKQLKITPAQEDQWKTFADAMRDDGETMGQLYEQRIKNASTQSAIDNMQDYANLTQAHADGIKKILAAFQPLYNSFTPEQKKLADDTFRERMGPREHRGAHAKSQK